MAPTESTTVLDIGVDDVGFGEHPGCRTLNFFEELYPWPQRVTALGQHEGARFERAIRGLDTSRATRSRSPSRTTSSTSPSRTP